MARTYIDFIVGIVLVIYGQALLGNVMRRMYSEEGGEIDWLLSAALIVVGLAIIFASLVDLGFLP